MCRKWYNHITVSQLIGRDSKRRLVTGYTSQCIQFTLSKQPCHSDAAWGKKKKKEKGKKRKEVEEHHKMRDVILYLPDINKGLLWEKYKMPNAI